MLLSGSDTNHNKRERDLLTLASSLILKQTTASVTKSRNFHKICGRTGFEVASSTPFLPKT